MNELYEFLMDGLSAINEVFDDESMRAHETCAALAIDGFPIPETFFRFYTSKIDVSEEILMNALAYFSGAEILQIDCDCEDKYYCGIPLISENDFYSVGQNDKMSFSDCYTRIIADLGAVRKEFIE